MGGGGGYLSDTVRLREFPDSAQKPRALFFRRNQTRCCGGRKSPPVARYEAIHRIAQEGWNQPANRRQSRPDSTQIFRGVEHRAGLNRSFAVCDPKQRFDRFEMELAAQVFPEFGVARNKQQVVPLFVAKDELNGARAESTGAVVHQQRRYQRRQRVVGRLTAIAPRMVTDVPQRHRAAQRVRRKVRCLLRLRVCGDGSFGSHTWRPRVIDEPQRHWDTEKISSKKYSVSLCLSGRWFSPCNPRCAARFRICPGSRAHGRAWPEVP